MYNIKIYFVNCSIEIVMIRILVLKISEFKKNKNLPNEIFKKFNYQLFINSIFNHKYFL